MGEGEKYLVERTWYGDSRLRWLLMPLTAIYALVTSIRRFLYRAGLFPTTMIGVPVIVVGNITVGGTGKSPVAIWLAKSLKGQGWTPGIVSRGYRGTVGANPVAVDADSDPAIVGDEPIMLAAESNCPVVVHPDRVAAAQMLADKGVDVVIADDGLQHYRLGRNMEIAVIDGARGIGNGSLLPSGPLREPAGRLGCVDVILVQRADKGLDIFESRGQTPMLEFRLDATAASKLDGSEVRSLDDFSGTAVHAVAGIGNPERFFRMLEARRIEVERRPLADHAVIAQSDLDSEHDLPVLMTAKDAVKCRALNTANCWQVSVDVAFEGETGDVLLKAVHEALSTAPKAAG